MSQAHGIKIPVLTFASCVSQLVTWDIPGKPTKDRIMICSHRAVVRVVRYTEWHLLSWCLTHSNYLKSTAALLIGVY